METKYIFIGIGIISLIVLAVIFIPKFIDKDILPKTNTELCSENNGEWKQFVNSCSDLCDKPIKCLTMTTMSCDCGKDKCWDGSECVIPDKPYYWSYQIEGFWMRGEKNCEREEYLCESYCYPNTYIDIWDRCFEEGNVTMNDKNEEVLCFKTGCLPRVKKGECLMVCNQE